jgi:hypothetical protein
LTVTLALVYEPAATPVVDNANVIAPDDPPPVNPVPAVTPVTVPAPPLLPYPCDLTQAVVAILVLLSLDKGVGAVGAPVNTGLDIGAYEVKSVAGIVEIAVSTYVLVAA